MATKIWATFIKDPDVQKSFTINWASPDATNDASANDIGYLQSRTISSDAWTVPTGITSASESNTTTTSTITLTGGTAGADYDLTCVITMSTGDTESRTIRIQVREQ